MPIGHFQAQGKDHRGVRGYGERAAGLHAAKPEKFGQYSFLQPCDPRIAPVEYLQDGTVLFPVYPARFERVHARTLRSVRRFDRTESDGARADQGTAERLYQNGEVKEQSEIFDEFGISPNLIESLLRREQDEQGNFYIAWGNQKVG